MKRRQTKTETPTLSMLCGDSKPNPVLTKTDFVRRYQAGEFGNRAPTWDTLKDFLKDRYSGLVHIRNRVAGGTTHYNVESSQVSERWNELLCQGTPPQTLYISGMSPHQLNLLQGEVLQTERHLQLKYSRVVGKPMREALAEEELHAFGIRANHLLRSVMCSNSYEWLQYLLSAYPEHVIEISVFSSNWGTLRNHNTVFWECRKY